MKLAIFHMGFFYSGGGERTVINEALHLQERGHTVDVFAPIVRRDKSFPDLIQRIRITGYVPRLPIPIPMREAVSILASSFFAPAFMRKFKSYDALVCHGQPSAWIGYQVHRLLKIPYLCYLHQPNRFLYRRPIDAQVGWRVNPSLSALSLFASGPFKGVTRTMDLVSVLESSAILANSKWTAERVEKIYGRKPTLCYGGVTLGGLTKERSARVDGPFILSTNRHYPQKRIDWLLEMSPTVLRKCPEVRIVVSGAFTAHTQYLLALRDRLGLREKVLFLGEVSEEELSSLYRSASCFAYPAPEEDLGLGPLEAAAHETPSVVWDYAGPAETVIDGVTGYKAKPYEMDDFAMKLALMLTRREEAYRMGEAAYRHVKGNFTWEQHVGIIENVLHEVVS